MCKPQDLLLLLRSPVLKKIALDIPLEEPFIDELKPKPSKQQVQLKYVQSTVARL